MILCLDCGNTRLKFGVGDAGGWHGQAALPLTELDKLAAVLDGWPPAARAIGCIVAGAAPAAVIEATLARRAMTLTWIQSSAAQAGVRNRYDRPAQLGADRWAALVGARALHGGPCLVVNAGTATTVDVLDGAGIFQGGLILPGLALMRSSLAGATARLPQANGRHAELPRNTDDAIVSGALEATAGAIERLFRRLGVAAGAVCLLSGGAAEELAPHLGVPLRRVDNLVLEGLLRLADA